MKRLTLTHGLWASTSILTFATGWLLRTPSGENLPSGSPSSVRTVESRSNSSGPIGLSGRPGSNAKGSGPDSPTTRVVGAAEIEAISKEAFNDPNPLTRNLAFARLLESMTPENVQLVMESLRSNRAGGEQWQLFTYAWGAMDGAGAIAHAATLENGPKNRFLAQAVTGWASKEPQAATAWLEQLPDGEEKNRFRNSLVGGLADKDIGLATAYVLQRAQAGDKQAANYLEIVAGEEIRKNGAQAAIAWGESLPAGALKGAALEEIAGSYVERDPEAAATWATKYAATEYGSRVVEEIGSEWAERDPKKALSWLESLPEGAGKAEGTFSALREWTRRDAVAASEHLSAMPPSPAKDSAVSGFARSLAWQDPEAAVIWAKTITDEQSRVQTLTRAGQAWFRRDPAAASQWLQSAALPPDAQQAIMNPPRDQNRRRRG